MTSNRIALACVALSLVAVSSGCVAVAGEFPVELIDFVPYEGNPLFTATWQGTWDDLFRERGCILREGDTWHLWYTGYNLAASGGRKRLGYATSSDGLTWTRHPDNPLSDSWIEDMHVVKDGDVYYMVAEGEEDVAHLSTSTDGVHWTEHGPLDVRYSTGEPLSPGPYGTPTLWKEGQVWYLFYEREDAGVWLATSTDARVWTNVQEDPVIRLGPDPYDLYAVAMKQVVRYQDRYYAYYGANDDVEWRGPWTTNIAVSDDLIHWTKYRHNPVIPHAHTSVSLVDDGEEIRLYTMDPDVRVWFPRGSRRLTARPDDAVQPRAPQPATPIPIPTPIPDQELWVRGDLHAHSSASDDAGLPVSQVAGLARASGCDFLAITDHGYATRYRNPLDGVAGTRFYERWLTARRRWRPMTLLLGVEWRPTYDQKVLVVLEQTVDERELIESFLERFEATRRYAPDPVEACRWLDERTGGSAMIFLGEATAPRTGTTERTWWADLEDFRRFSGALEPRRAIHLASRDLETARQRIAAYRRHLLDSDTPASIVNRRLAVVRGAVAKSGGRRSRWIRKLEGLVPDVEDVESTSDDRLLRECPLVVAVEASETAPPDLDAAGRWDEMLHAGASIGVVVGSNFHDRGDDPPCNRLQNVLPVLENSARAVVQALRDHRGMVVHGGILSRVDIAARAGNSESTAGIGDTLVVDEGSDLEVVITLEVPQTDSAGRSNRLTRVELVSDISGRPMIETRWTGRQIETHGGRASLTHRLQVVRDRNDGRGFYLRLAGRSAREGWFYSNPIWIRIR